MCLCLNGFIPQSTEDDGQQAADKRRCIDGDNVGIELLRQSGDQVELLTLRMPVPL